MSLEDKNRVVKKIFVSFFGIMLAGLLCSPICGAGEVLNMKISTFFSPQHPSTKLVEEMAAELSAASDGRVVLKHYGSGSLGSPSEQVDITVEGLADMSITCCGYKASKYPLSLVVQLPLFSDSALTGTKVLMALMDKGIFDEEFKDVEYMFPTVTTPSRVFSNKQISTLEDFKGLRMVGGELILRDIAKALGASVYTFEMPDVYLAVQRRSIDAAVNSWMMSMSAYKWHEVTKCALDMPILSGWNCNFVMNKTSWSKLPPDVQAKWKKLYPKFAIKAATTFDQLDGVMRDRWRQVPTVKVSTLSEADQRKFAQLVIPIWQQWVERNGKKGEEIYSAYVDVMKEMGKPVQVRLPGLYHD